MTKPSFFSLLTLQIQSYHDDIPFLLTKQCYSWFVRTFQSTRRYVTHTSSQFDMSVGLITLGEKIKKVCAGMQPWWWLLVSLIWPCIISQRCLGSQEKHVLKNMQKTQQHFECASKCTYTHTHTRTRGRKRSPGGLCYLKDSVKHYATNSKPSTCAHVSGYVYDLVGVSGLSPVLCCTRV